MVTSSFFWHIQNGKHSFVNKIKLYSNVLLTRFLLFRDVTWGSGRDVVLRKRFRVHDLQATPNGEQLEINGYQVDQ